MRRPVCMCVCLTNVFSQPRLPSLTLWLLFEQYFSEARSHHFSSGNTSISQQLGTMCRCRCHLNASMVNWFIVSFKCALKAFFFVSGYGICRWWMGSIHFIPKRPTKTNNNRITLGHLLIWRIGCVLPHQPFYSRNYCVCVMNVVPLVSMVRHWATSRSLKGHIIFYFIVGYFKMATLRAHIACIICLEVKKKENTLRKFESLMRHRTWYMNDFMCSAMEFSHTYAHRHSLSEVHTITAKLIFMIIWKKFYFRKLNKLQCVIP